LTVIATRLSWEKLVPSRYKGINPFSGEDTMKPIAWLFLAVLCSVTLVQAQSSGGTMELSGTICQSTCVTQVNNVPTCDKTCTDKSGEPVLVGDNGHVMKIAKQDQPMCNSHMGKHVKMKARMATPTESEREQDIRIMQMAETQVGG
jgi:hypothetical protein